MLYFLEVGRQAFMLNAHQRWGVPPGIPMNLLHLRFTLDAPLPRDRVFELTPVSEPQPWNGLMLTSRFGVELALGGQVLGRGELLAQAIAPELYEMQRQPNHSAP